MKLYTIIVCLMLGNFIQAMDQSAPQHHNQAIQTGSSMRDQETQTEVSMDVTERLLSTIFTAWHSI